MTRTGWLAAAAVVLLAFFAVQGGEYSTGDYLALRRQAGQERASIAALTAELDSLQALARAIERDPAVQERIAREEYGMIRDGEILYRIVEPEPAPGP